MRFSCDSCSQQYNIADEKVRGKVLKVRCKKCGNTIVLRGEPGSGPIATVGRPAAPAPLHDSLGAAGDTKPVRPQADTERTRMMPLDDLERAVQASRAPEAQADAAPASFAPVAKRAAAVPAPARAARAALGSATAPRAAPPPPPVAAPPPPPVAAPPPPPVAAPKEEAVWYAVLGGAQQGPFTRAELGAKAAAGAVKPRTYVWRDGMPVWLRAQEVAELATLLAMSPAAPTGLATVENLAEVRARRAAHAAPAPVAEVAPTPAPRAEAKKPEPRPETKKPEAKKPEPRREAKNPEPTPKPAAHAFEDDEGDQTSADGSPLQLSSERTVVDRFELPAEPPASAVAPVAEVAPAPAIAAHDAAVAAVAALGLEETTPIEPSNVPGAGTAAPLAAVLSAGVAPAAEAPAERAVTGSQPLVAPWIEPAPAAPPPPVGDPFASVPDAPSFHAAKPGETTNSIIRMSGAKKSQGWKALLILGVFGAMLIGAAFYIAKNPSAVGLDPNAFGGEDEGPKGPGIGGTGNFAGLDRLEKHRQAAPSPGAVSPAAASHPHSGSAAASGRPVDKEGAIVTKAEAAPVKQLTDEEKQLLAIAAGDEKHLNFHGPKVEEAPKDVDKASGGLDGAAVMSKVKDNMPAFQRCVQEAARRNPNLKVGKVKIGATIGASGVVTSAVINDPPAMNDSDLGKCLRNTVKRVLFPSFAGDAQEVELPLVLGVGG